MRIIRASRSERLNYRRENELFGFIRISHAVCAIELIGRDIDEGVVLRAPAGQCFMPSKENAIAFDSIEKLQANLKGTEIRLWLVAA